MVVVNGNSDLLERGMLLEVVWDLVTLLAVDDGVSIVTENFTVILVFGVRKERLEKIL